MRIFALGDPHLSFNDRGEQSKPMDIFGEHWQEHTQRLRRNWQQKVGQEDIVLIPGDISWAMTLEEAQVDLNFLGDLPGEKIIIKGNHELWWDTISKVRQILPMSMRAIQNDHILLENRLAICGTRGWQCPDGEFADPHDAKIFAREIGRLARSLESVPPEITQKIVMLHFPPTNWKKEMSPFIELLLAHRVQTCVYGHLHSTAIGQNLLPAEKWGIAFRLASADYLQFTPQCIYNDEDV